MALSPRSVLVTGASRGIGLEFVKQLVKLPKPPEVIIACCRKPENASELRQVSAAHSSVVHVIKMDVVEDEDIAKALEVTEKLVGDQGLSLLINNAGVSDNKQDGGRLCVQTRERMRKHFEVNATSPLIVSQKFLPLLRLAAKQGVASERDNVSANRAAIVMISSIMSSQNISLDCPDINENNLHYRCSKAALNMATVLMSRDLMDSGILVMALHPGWVRTAMGGPNGELTAEQSALTCLKVIGQAGPSSQGRLSNYSGEFLPF